MSNFRGLLDALRDPKNSQGMLDMGMSLMGASGPSPVPMSFGQRLASGYVGSQQMAMQRAIMQQRQQQGDTQQKLAEAQIADLQKKDEPKQRRIVQGPDGRSYYEGGEDALPNVATPAKPTDQTTDVREYEYALKQGFKGSFVDFQKVIKRAGASSVNVNSGDDRYGKPPSGWWRPDENRPDIAPQPGGPGEQMPTEAAGRKAMMENARTAVQRVEDGLFDKNGKLDRRAVAEGVTGLAFSKGRQIRGSVKIAIESAMRAATGAAAPESEVDRFTDMFTPSVLDSDEQAKEKLGYLKDFVTNTDKYLSAGRGQPGPSGVTLYPDAPRGASPAGGGDSNDPLGLRR